jgi:uroporphyrinogen-III synthase
MVRTDRFFFDQKGGESYLPLTATRNTSNPMSLFLLTRPAHQAKNLTACIKEKGGRCILLPTLVIQPQPPEKMARAIARLPSVHAVIFTSANAVSPVMPHWHTLTSAPAVFAVGPATAAALKHYKIHVTIPASYNSEGLLALPALHHVQHQNIVLFAGKGGRSILKKTLQKRGANVQKIATYTRLCPNISPDMFPITEDVVIIATSETSLKNLWKMAGTEKHTWLKKQPVLVISKKMALLARQLGFTQPPIEAKNATDQAIVEAIMPLLLQGK